MATWQDLSLDCLAAAKLLADDGRLRSSVSRSYYAAYCAIGAQLQARRISFAHGWRNPSHDQLHDLVAHNLPLSISDRRKTNRHVRFLRQAREDADYHPGVAINKALAVTCLHLANVVMSIMGIHDD